MERASSSLMIHRHDAWQHTGVIDDSGCNVMLGALFRRLNHLPYSNLPYLSDHVKQAPTRFIVLWVVACASTLLCVAIIGYHWWCHFRVGDELRKSRGRVLLPRQTRLTFKILVMVPQLALFSCVGLFYIRLGRLFGLFSNLAYMTALFALWDLLCEMLGGPERCIAVLHHEPPMKFLTEFWICKCLRPLDGRRFHLSHFYWSRIMVMQHAMIGPALLLTQTLVEDFMPMLDWVGILSQVVCGYGLSILIAASRKPLREYRSDWKAWMVMISDPAIMQYLRLVLTYLAHRRVCAALLNQQEPAPSYTEEVMSEAYANCLTCVLTVPLSLWAVYAFPAREVKQCVHRFVEPRGGETQDNDENNEEDDTNLLSSTSTPPSEHDTATETHILAVGSSHRHSPLYERQWTGGMA